MSDIKLCAKAETEREGERERERGRERERKTKKETSRERKFTFPNSLALSSCHARLSSSKCHFRTVINCVDPTFSFPVI